MTTIRKLIKSGKITLDTVVLGELPMTADGAVVVEESKIYWWDGDILLVGFGYLEERCVFSDPNDTDSLVEPNAGMKACYSTRAAAEAARSNA